MFYHILVHYPLIHIFNTFHIYDIFKPKRSSHVKGHKDPTNLLTTNNVVYKKKCSNCSLCYIGQTKMALITLTKEHQLNFKLTARKRNLITKLCCKFKHNFDFENAGNHYSKRINSKMLFIKNLSNTGNIQLDIENLNKL